MSAELMHVPTAPELGLRGLAQEIRHTVRKADGSTKSEARWRLTAEGQRLVNEAQAHNAAVLNADPEMRRAAERAAYKREIR